MSHAVETMAYTNEVPWHGLGFHVADSLTAKQMLKAAKLDWRVEKQALFLQDGTEINDNFALIRPKDGTVFGIVGNKYVPVQNEDAFEFFKEFVEAGKAKMETAGSLKGGKYVWGLANLNSSFKMRNNDVVKGYMLVGVPHEPDKSLLFKMTSVRVVCANTLALALRDKGGEFRMPHRVEFNDKAIQRAKDGLGVAREQFGEFEKNARLLQSLKISRTDAIKLLAPIYQQENEVKDVLADFNDLANKRMRQLMGILTDAPGAEPDTAWGLLNACTYYCDHIASRTTDTRLTNAWMGKEARNKEALLETLLQMA